MTTEENGNGTQEPGPKVVGEIEWGGEGIGALVTALASAQAKFGAIVKNKVARIRGPKGNYDYSYADLADVLDAVRGPLATAGIVLTQPATNNGPVVTARTVLLRANNDGEIGWVRSPAITVFADNERPQALGSAITYARRYSVGALLGISPEADDDGNAAESHDHSTEERSRGGDRRQEQGRPEPKPEQKPEQKPKLPDHVTLAWKKVKDAFGQETASRLWEVAAKAITSEPSVRWTPEHSKAVLDAFQHAVTEVEGREAAGGPYKWGEEQIEKAIAAFAKFTDIPF